MVMYVVVGVVVVVMGVVDVEVVRISYRKRY
jgi:hypothetical protein